MLADETQDSSDQAAQPTTPAAMTAPTAQPPASDETIFRTAAIVSLSEPSFLHPSSIVFEAASHIRRFLVPAIVAVYSAASGGVFGLGIAGLLFGGALVSTMLRYFTLRYRIQGNDFVVTEGLLFRRVRSVPIRRIQNIDLVQNVLHRLFGVAEVNIETASGTKPEATLRVLTQAQIEELRQALFGVQSIADEHLGDVPATAAEQASPASLSNPATAQLSAASATSSRKLIHQIPLKHLILAGLASNRGAVLLGILTGLFFQNNYAWDAGRTPWKIDLGRVKAFLPPVDGPYAVAIFAVVGLLALLLFLRLFGVAWYVLRFYGHELTRQGNDLRVSCGLFTKVSATIPRPQIQFISVHRSWIMRWLKLASIRIETAGGGGGEHENAASTVSRRWFLPVVAVGDVARLLSELRPGLDWHESQVEWQAVSPLTARRLMRVAIIISILLSGIGWLLLRPWGMAVGGVAFPLLAYGAVRKSRAMRYVRTSWGVAYRSGVLTRKLSFAFYDRIQIVGLKQSPFDRRWNMAALAIDTAAAGPADHLIEVAYLDADFAAQQFSELQLATAQHRPSWG